MRLVKSILLMSTLLSTTAMTARADVNVVASIKPVHSLVAAVMEGVGEPGLIVEGAASPHTYALKPSQAKILEQADVVFWFGHELEAFLEKPLEAIATNAKAVELLDAHDLMKLKFREGGAFDAHDHGDHDDHDDHGHDEHGHDEHKHDDHKHDDHKHDDHAHEEHDHEKEKMADAKMADKDHHDHDEHKHDDHHDHKHDEHEHEKEHAEHKHDEKHDEKHADHDDHDHDKHKEMADAHEGHDHHDHGEFDPHVWLDPMNAKALVHEIEETLVEADPANAAKYEANAEALMAKLDMLTTEITAQLEPVKDQGFVVFHDAYQYFENRFGLKAVGSITVSPEVLPGAERIGEIRAKIEGLSATCVFSEPQFESKLVTTVTEGTAAKSGVLDPLGAEIEDGPELYLTLLKNMATSFQTCLSKG